MEKAKLHIEKAIGDKRVKVDLYEPGTDPVVSGNDFLNFGWLQIKNALSQVWQEVPLIPFVMTAATDSRHYQELSKCIFRFSAKVLDDKELNRIHSFDERISVENLKNELSFFTHLLESL